MKPILFQNPKTEKESFYVQEDVGNKFYDQLHYHPEIQLTTILKGKGTMFIGDKILDFEPGDVFLIGENIPHVLKSDPEYYDDDSILDVHGISIYFKKEAFGNDFFQLPELTKMKTMLDNSSRGIRMIGNLKTDVSKIILSLKGKMGSDRIITLLSALNTFSQEKSFEYLASVNYQRPQKESDHWRINAVLEHIMSNADKRITLEEAADVAMMSPTAFCRFFKQRTRKTFINFVNEVKIGNACKLLINKDLNVSEVCYMTGFNNISNFNRQFKMVTGFTPTNYLDKFGKAV